MTNKFVTLTALAALSLSPTLALAQSPTPAPTTPPAATDPATPDTTAPNMPAEKMPSAPGNAATTTVPATPKFVSAQGADQWLGSDLIGTDVVTANDESLGEISDVVMEKDGRVIAAVIDVGGFLGIGAKPVAVSFDSLTLAPTDGEPKIVVAMTKEDLNQAPEFKSLADTRTATDATTGAAKTQ